MVRGEGECTRFKDQFSAQHFLRGGHLILYKSCNSEYKI